MLYATVALRPLHILFYPIIEEFFTNKSWLDRKNSQDPVPYKHPLSVPYRHPLPVPYNAPPCNKVKSVFKKKHFAIFYKRYIFIWQISHMREKRLLEVDRLPQHW